MRLYDSIIPISLPFPVKVNPFWSIIGAPSLAVVAGVSVPGKKATVSKSKFLAIKSACL